MLKPQDVLIVLKLVSLGDQRLSQFNLGKELGMSPSEVNSGIERAKQSGLLLPSGTPNTIRILEFLKQGLPYIYPGELGPITRGIATSYAASPLNQVIVAEEDDLGPVWPHPKGDRKGHALQPIYRSVPDAALRDTTLYELLTLVDALRIGRARERGLAAEFLEKRLRRQDLVERTKVRSYKFDLARAVTTPLCQYFMRLAQPVNDLLSVEQLLHTDMTAMPFHVQDGVRAYLLRLHASHLVEDLVAFVEKPTTDVLQKDAIKFIRANEALAPRFEQLRNIHKDKQFASLKRVRNSFVFHYNYDKHGEDTMNAVRRLLPENDPDNGLVIRPTSYEESSFLLSRNVFADRIAVEGWFHVADVPTTSDPSGIQRMRDHTKFVGLATAAFIEFAESAFLEWIDANNLQSIEQSASG